MSDRIKITFGGMAAFLLGYGAMTAASAYATAEDPAIEIAEGTKQTFAPTGVVQLALTLPSDQSDQVAGASQLQFCAHVADVCQVPLPNPVPPPAQ